MVAPIKSINNPKLSLNILSPEEINHIHSATLDVIESIGIKFPSRNALKILESHGAEINWDTYVAKVPGAIIEEHLSKAPGSYTLAGIDPKLDLPLDGHHSYLGTDGCGVEILDAFTGKRRRSTKKDVAEVHLLADYLEEIAFHWVSISAQDCHPHSRSLHELEAVWGVSKKHLQTESIVSESEMKTAIEMATLLTGGRDKLRKRPILSIMQCTASPLGHDGGSIDAGLIAAEAGLPVGYMTMASCGGTGPVTLAGNLIVGNAEVIAVLALMQMAYPGSPVYYAAAQTATDLRTGGYTGGGPEDFLFGAATNLLADFYNVPLSMGAFATGAKEPNWQAGIDNSLSSFMAVSTHSDMLLGAGLLHGSRIFSYEMLLMDCEIWDILHSMFTGIIIDDEMCALDTIKKVGHSGTYLGQQHTKKFMHRRWKSTLMDRRSYNVWEEKKDGPRQWALERARKILTSHKPDPLEEKLNLELQNIIRKHEGQYCK
jgi:trimethylamine--corrinoid protein Co-methyltransferase